MAEYVEVQEYITEAVINAYNMADEDPEAMPCPHLHEIYDNFFHEVIDNIGELVEEVFGDGDVTSEKLQFIGINENGIPPLHLVRTILNILNKPYIHDDKLYNTLQLRFFK